MIAYPCVRCADLCVPGRVHHNEPDGERPRPYHQLHPDSLGPTLPVLPLPVKCAQTSGRSNWRARACTDAHRRCCTVAAVLAVVALHASTCGCWRPCRGVSRCCLRSTRRTRSSAAKSSHDTARTSSNAPQFLFQFLFFSLFGSPKVSWLLNRRSGATGCSPEVSPDG